MMLAGLSTGTSVIEGRVALYSCKLAGDDKRVSKSLEQHYIDELQTLDMSGDSSLDTSGDSAGMGTSPIGPLSDSSSRRTLINLILTLNASFPDYDFRWSALTIPHVQHSLHKIVAHVSSCVP